MRIGDEWSRRGKAARDRDGGARGSGARFWAKAGNRPDIEEHFAHAVARWLVDWTASFLVPADTPVDPEFGQQWLARVERARRDLELQGEEGGA
jgi:hypothetical protein